MLTSRHCRTALLVATVFSMFFLHSRAYAAKHCSPEEIRTSEPPQLSFVEWRRQFVDHLAAIGVPKRTIRQGLQYMRLNEKVLALDRRQPDYTKQIWEFLDGAISTSRIRRGRSLATRHAVLFDRIEDLHGVDRHVLLAIWGLESAYGSFRGDMSVFEALSTLAYDGRRRDFAERELEAAFRIASVPGLDVGQMVGSWAGAMGHTQFMPTSYLSYGRDGEGDGIVDIWSDDPVDALNSTAVYLKQKGWIRGESWLREVQAPTEFDWSLTGENKWHDSGKLAKLGVRPIGWGSQPGFLLPPAGRNGPLLVLSRNFDVIKAYNNSTPYALAVGLLANRLAGDGPLQASWPRGDRALSRNDKLNLQRALARRCMYSGKIDGAIGPITRAALQAFQQDVGLPADGYPSLDTLRRLR